MKPSEFATIFLVGEAMGLYSHERALNCANWMQRLHFSYSVDASLVDMLDMLSWTVSQKDDEVIYRYEETLKAVDRVILVLGLTHSFYSMDANEDGSLDSSELDTNNLSGILGPA